MRLSVNSGQKTPKNKKASTKHFSLTPYLYILPIALILLTFVGGSVLNAVLFSFTSYNIISPAKFTGLSNYTRLLSDSKFLLCVGNTLKLAVMTIPLELVVSTVLGSLLAHRQKTIIGKLAIVALFIPFLSADAVCGIVWKSILNGGNPVVEAIFGLFGIRPEMLLGSSESAMWTLALINVWKSMGYYTIIIMGAVLNISPSFYEAAEVDGANVFQQFMHITLPQLKPTLIMCLFLVTISSMQIFDIVYTMTGGGPSMSTTTLVMYAYQLTFKSAKAGYGMAVSNVLMIIMFIALIAQQRLLKRESSEV